MGKMNKVIIGFLAAMVVLTLAVFFRFNLGGSEVSLSGISVLVGLAAYFITAKANEYKNAGLDIRWFPGQLKDIRLWALILLPVLLNVLSTVLERAILPEYAAHLKARVAVMLDPEQAGKTWFNLVVMALGEEIAWRAFFQRQTAKRMNFVPALLLTSALFALGHYAPGKPAIVAYDLFGVFVNACVYGLVFRKTDNAWCSWLSHFLANAAALLMMVGGAI